MPVLLRSRRSLVIGLASGALALPIVLARFDTSSAVMLGFSMMVTWLVSAWLVFAVTEQSRRLRDMAVTDPLTGAYNRRYLEEQARHAIDALQRDKVPASLLLIDVDFFKRINDNHGHAAGDAVLIEVAQRLRATLREADLIVRWGGLHARRTMLGFLATALFLFAMLASG